MKKALIAALAGVLLLAGCGGNAHKGEHCVQSHEESGLLPIVTMAGKVPVTTYIPYDDTVCDKWAPDDPKR